MSSQNNQQSQPQSQRKSTILEEAAQAPSTASYIINVSCSAVRLSPVQRAAIGSIVRQAARDIDAALTMINSGTPANMRNPVTMALDYVTTSSGARSADIYDVLPDDVEISG